MTIHDYILPVLLPTVILVIAWFLWDVVIKDSPSKAATKSSVPVQRVRQSPFVTTSSDPVPVAEVEYSSDAEVEPVSEMVREPDFVSSVADDDLKAVESFRSDGVSELERSPGASVEDVVISATADTSPSSIAIFNVSVSRVTATQLLSTLEDSSKEFSVAGSLADISSDVAIRDLQHELSQHRPERPVAVGVVIVCSGCQRAVANRVGLALASVFPNDLRLIIHDTETEVTVYILDGETSNSTYQFMHSRVSKLQLHLAAIGAAVLSDANVPAIHRSFDSYVGDIPGRDAPVLNQEPVY